MIADMRHNQLHYHRQQLKQQRQRKKHIVFRTTLFLLSFVAFLDCSICATDGSEPVCNTNVAADCNFHNKEDNNDHNHHIFSAHRLDHGVLEWIANQPGAYYNPKQFMDKREGLVGIFATGPIAEGELLCRIPWEWTLHGDLMESSQLSCSLVESLQQHLQLGEASKYAPYIEYLKNQPYHQLVSAWSKAGQDLMLRILGQTREENNYPEAYGGNPHSLALHFPPDVMTNWLDGEYRNICKGDQSGYKAAIAALMRADDSIMIPGYDFYNHRNGYWHNADTEILWNTAHETRATRDIDAGEQIFISYNRCSDCEQRHDWYGTAEMFRDYGFIENFPQRWHYLNLNEVDFELHDQGSHTYLVEWIHQPESNDDVVSILSWLQEQVRRLERVWYLDYHGQRGTYTLAAEAGVSEFEWNTTWAFQQANLLALRAAIQALSIDPTRETMEVTVPPLGVGDEHDDLPVDISDLYHPLDYADNMWRRIDADVIGCSIELDDDYEVIEKYSGLLQRIDISQADMDICLSRNGHVHVCSSFRPMLYEYFVHPATSLLSTVKRVLIMGNGASFLLHEVMKYNSTLEFVMVLEPDPAVTRLTQKHFGVDPQWHDPRVQWWFGDVGAVLSLLSTVQLNSFDLVLIDLPKTGVDGIFRNGISAFDLVHERGVVVSRTNQWQEFSGLFDYTARMMYEPFSGCTQVLTLGSPSIDFIRAPAKVHGLTDSLLFFKPNLMMTPEGRLQLFHDWQSGVVTKAAEPRPASKSDHIHETLGVLEVLELGDVNCGADLEACMITVEAALKEIGQEVISTVLLSASDSVLLTLQDGYIIMRTTVPKEYVGVDISWSSNLGSLPSIHEAIVKAFSASILSVYRLVSNGHILPVDRIPQPEASTPVDRSDPLDSIGDLNQSTVIRAVLSEMVIKFLRRPQSAILVVCESAGQCLARDTIRDMYSTKTVYVLELCASGDESDQNVAELLECERKGRDSLQSTMTDENVKSMEIVLDGNLSKGSLQVLDALVNTTPRADWGTWIRQGNLLVALPSSSGQLSNAHRAFADRFQHTSTGVQRLRQDLRVPDVAVLAEFSLFRSATRAVVEVAVVVQGDDDTIGILVSMETSLSETTTYETQLRLVQGGLARIGYRVDDLYFDQSDYASRPLPAALPSGIQAFFHLVPANVPTSLSEVAEEMGSIFEYMNSELVRTEATSETANTTVIFQFEFGHWIVSKDDTGFALNLFYSCNGPSESETRKNPCTPEFALDLVRPLLKERLTNLLPASLTFLPRGSSPNMIFSRGSFGTYGENSMRQEEEEEEEEDDQE